ncbi:hypothetical protein PHSY_004227 [Pseudozyma hubeiensis SY62]|uniref:Uncharacterized protein n=1 Tax=Pseudozyma hubeiensis (strain SY62) TaxID=1305764 RepID=R9P5P0_PSEHS|nr:hypothetical protein PHSY_004227 [Pseudozyma hubeiensis SY62]GAC96644.1 hypothetical protein PHSY_004227 [Pseudozyma hubeiensis SY62]
MPARLACCSTRLVTESSELRLDFDLDSLLSSAHHPPSPLHSDLLLPPSSPPPLSSLHLHSDPLAPSPIRQATLVSKMAPLAKFLAGAAVLAAPALAAVAPKLQLRQYQNPDSTLVIDEPSCNFYQCTIYWAPGQQVAVNWYNPPSSGDVQIDLMANNDTSELAYTVGVAPAISNTCDAGNGYGQPGSNGKQCGGFVFTVPSSWNAGNYSALRAMSVQDQNLVSYTDKIYITHNGTTSNSAQLSIVSGSTVGSGSSTVAPSSTAAAGAGTTTTASGSAASTSASRSSGSVSTTGASSGSSASSTGSPRTNGALSSSNAGTAVFTAAAAVVAGLSILL